jgi:hypothetical protein
VILLGEARGPRFCIADTLAGAAPFGEDLTVVVVGGEERQPVSNTHWSRFSAKQQSEGDSNDMCNGFDTIRRVCPY